jgi:hypothetical protein
MPSGRSGEGFTHLAWLMNRSPHLGAEHGPMLAVGDAKGRITIYKLDKQTVGRAAQVWPD